MVSNALAYKQSRLMFVPTGFWVDLGYQQLKTVNSQVSGRPCIAVVWPAKPLVLPAKHMSCFVGKGFVLLSGQDSWQWNDTYSMRRTHFAANKPAYF